VDERYRLGRFAIELLEKLDECRLALASSQDAGDLPSTRVERSEQLQGALSLVLVLEMHRYEPGLSRSRRNRSRTWLQ
jgi:hypothetical protein